MGRQAHITRLALGRSPFDDPLRDQNGDFILGENAHENDASPYRQQFDDRGHPQNRSSKNAVKKLRRAQNDVLETVGVAVRKGEERKNDWEKLEASEKRSLIQEENHIGNQLVIEDRAAGLLLSWYVASLRTRLMTLTNYSSLPLTSIVSKEIRLLGLPRCLFSGLPYYLLGSVPQVLRYYIPNPDIEEMVEFTPPYDRKWIESTSAAVQWYSATTVMQCLELPLFIHATLQTMHIVPPNIGLNLKSFVPFTASSPVNLPPLPPILTTDTITNFVVQLVHTPLLLYLCRDYMRAQLRYRLYALLRQLLTKPDRPDSISAKVSDENEAMVTTSIAGIGYAWEEDPDDPNYAKNRRSFGPRSFFGALRIAFPPIYKLCNLLSRGRLAKSRGRLSSELERQLRTAVTQTYWHHRNAIDDQPKRGSPQDMHDRQWAFANVFFSLKINPTEELVDPKGWIDDVLGPKADVQRFRFLLQQASNDQWNEPSQPNNTERERTDLHQYDDAVSNVLAEISRAIPVSDVIIIQATDGQAMILARQSSGGTQNLEEMENIRTIDAGEMPLEAFIRRASGLNRASNDNPLTESSSRDVQPQSERHTSSRPPTPTPGISRALSLSDSQVQVTSQSNPRPLRRPTETDESIAAMSRTLRAEAETLRSPRPSVVQPSPTRERFEQPLLTPMKHHYYRVTVLSNLAADSLAWHTSALLTSFVLWPLEAIWLRSVAGWALQNPALTQYIDPWWSARLGFGIIGRPVSVLSLGAWFGGSHTPSERLGYLGTVLLTSGLEGIIRGACWSLGVWYVKRRKDKYGWGQF